MKIKFVALALLALLTATAPAYSEEDRIELKTTTIKGNKELPKILFVVPWKNVKHAKHAERKLVLHSLFGDLFDPVVPTYKSEN